MDYKRTTPWIVVKRFLFGWAIAAGILVIISCVKYREFIVTAFVNNLGWFEEKKLQTLLHLRRPVRLVIAVGYAAPGNPLRAKKRKTMEELTTWK